MEKLNSFVGSLIGSMALVGIVVVSYNIGRGVRFLDECYNVYREVELEEKNKKK